MAMNKHSSLRSRGSLIERAAEVYDFASALRAPPAPRMPDENLPAWNPPSVTSEAPRVRRAAGRTGIVDRTRLAEGGFIVPDGPANALAEEFRIAKRQLLRGAFGGSGVAALASGRTILVCSAQPDEGKTYCAVNLALSIAAESDIDVLLVDADLPKPEILTTLGLENGPGLIDAIADVTMDVESCVVATDIPNLSVLPAGRQDNNATELLASGRATALLAALVAHDARRVVILDSPPVLAASPASVLATHAGQTLMVVRADRSTEAQLRESLAMLAACPNIQLILNGVSFAGSGKRFGSYYGSGE
jgi:exopolysaccharide/PEP-CTERM locus tyrosine autokinase